MKKQFAAAIVAYGFVYATQAAQFNVTGFRENLDYQSEFGGYLETSVGMPSMPRFGGAWNIDIDASLLAGGMDFEPFSSHYSWTPIDDPDAATASADFYSPHTIFTFDTANAVINYDRDTRTLNLTQVKLILSGEPVTCTTTGWISCSVDMPDFPNLQENFSLSLIFDPAMSTFTGKATYSLSGDYGIFGSTDYFFNGTAVPAPATVWLFGSGLVGLGAVARRRLAAI